MALTAKQQRFVEEYLKDLNAAAAFRRAGYTAKNDRVAASNAYRLMINDDIAKEIATRHKQILSKVRLTAEEILQEIKILGKSNIWNYDIDDNGKVILAEGVPPEAIRAVSSIKRRVRHLQGGGREYETEIKLWDKNSAL